MAGALVASACRLHLLNPVREGPLTTRPLSVVRTTIVRNIVLPPLLSRAILRSIYRHPKPAKLYILSDA